jgi:hypothetical protein
MRPLWSLPGFPTVPRSYCLAAAPSRCSHSLVALRPNCPTASLSYCQRITSLWHGPSVFLHHWFMIPLPHCPIALQCHCLTFPITYFSAQSHSLSQIPSAFTVSLPSCLIARPACSPISLHRVTMHGSTIWWPHFLFHCLIVLSRTALL